MVKQENRGILYFRFFVAFLIACLIHLFLLMAPFPFANQKQAAKVAVLLKPMIPDVKKEVKPKKKKRLGL